MEFLPVIIKVLLALGAIFLIVLIISFMISKFRKEKEVVTESYPAEKYKYYSGSDSDSQSQFPMNKFYDIVDDKQVNGRYSDYVRNEQSPIIYQQQIYNNPIMEYNEPETFRNNWVDYEEGVYFENPLRKTSSFNVYSEPNRNKTFRGRMTIINDMPIFKYGWE